MRLILQFDKVEAFQEIVDLCLIIGFVLNFHDELKKKSVKNNRKIHEFRF